MKKILTIFSILLSFLFTSKLSAQWVLTNLGNIQVYSMTVKDSTLYAATGFNSGVNYTTNNGLNWIPTALNTGLVESVYSFGRYLLSAVRNQGILRSSDGGQHWTQTMNNFEISSFSSTSNYLFAAGYLGVYKSLDSGFTWIRVLQFNQDYLTVATEGSDIFAGAEYEVYSNGGLYHSLNFGQSWYCDTFFMAKSISAILINHPDIFVGTWGHGIYHSTDYGLNWLQTDINNISIPIIISFGTYIFAGTGNANSGYGVYLSSDNGTTWIQKNEGMGNITVLSLAIKGNYIFAGTYYNVWRRSLYELIGIKPISNSIPKNFSLSQNYPNPFNPTTIINFDIPKLPLMKGAGGMYVKLVVYDISGREVDVLVNEKLQAGSYKVDFPAPTGDGGKLSSGVYFYKLMTDEFMETRKMVLVK